MAISETQSVGVGGRKAKKIEAAAGPMVEVLLTHSRSSFSFFFCDLVDLPRHISFLFFLLSSPTSTYFFIFRGSTSNSRCLADWHYKTDNPHDCLSVAYGYAKKWHLSHYLFIIGPFEDVNLTEVEFTPARLLEMILCLRIRIRFH